MRQAYLNGFQDKTKGAHFNSFSDAYTIPAPDEFSWDLTFNTSDISVTFNTSGDTPTMEITNATCIALGFCNSSLVLDGYLGTTEGGTDTGLFTFHSIFIGPSVNVSVVGDRALVLISRSTAIIDTKIDVAPGTLGVSALSLSLVRTVRNGCFTTWKHCRRFQKRRVPRKATTTIGEQEAAPQGFTCKRCPRLLTLFWKCKQLQRRQIWVRRWAEASC